MKPKMTKIEVQKYAEYSAYLNEKGLPVRSQEEWVKHYRETQANVKRLREKAGETNQG